MSSFHSSLTLDFCDGTTFCSFSSFILPFNVDISQRSNLSPLLSLSYFPWQSYHSFMVALCTGMLMTLNLYLTGLFSRFLGPYSLYLYLFKTKLPLSLSTQHNSNMITRPPFFFISCDFLCKLIIL